MSSQFSDGDQVKWKWGRGFGRGTVVKKYVRKTTLTIKGSEITREASQEEPAYKIKQPRGNHVLKSQSELMHDSSEK